MQKRTKRFLLQFALDSIEQIESFIEGLSFSDFVRKPLPHDATILRLQFLGFALRDLSNKFKAEDTKEYLARKAERYNALTEDYRKVDDRRIWETITLDLSPLKQKLQSL